MRVNSTPVLDAARVIVESYDTPVTLRQLFYQLVAKQLLPNTLAYYKTLSARTAELRRDGDFPDLIDRTRTVHQRYGYSSPGQARHCARPPVCTAATVPKTKMCPSILASRRPASSISCSCGSTTLVCRYWRWAATTHNPMSVTSFATSNSNTVLRC
jgi:hypothetical protein